MPGKANNQANLRGNSGQGRSREERGDWKLPPVKSISGKKKAQDPGWWSCGGFLPPHPGKGWAKEADRADREPVIVPDLSERYWEPSGKVLMTIQGNRSKVKAESRKRGGDDVNYHNFLISLNSRSMDTLKGFSMWLNHHCSNPLNSFQGIGATTTLDQVSKWLLNGRNF